MDEQKISDAESTKLINHTYNTQTDMNTLKTNSELNLSILMRNESTGSLFYSNRSFAFFNKQESNEEVLKINFDDILDQIGFGWYQLRLYFTMGMFGMTDGSEVLVLSLLLPFLQKQWNFSDEDQILLGTSVYVGMFFGGTLSGIGDTYGRKIPSLICVFFLFIFAAVSAQSQNYWQFIILRTLYGVTLGFFSPINFALLGEITPRKRRGTAMTLMGLFYVGGELFCLFVAYFTTNDLQYSSGNWRGLLFYSSVLGLLCFILLLAWLDESPRYNLVKGNGHYDEAFATIDKMFKANYKQVSSEELTLSKEVKQGLRAWSEDYNLQSYDEKPADIKTLFTKSNYKKTLIIWYVWFVNNFSYYGIVFLLPKTLDKINKTHNNHKNEDSLLELLMSSLTEIPAPIIIALLIDCKTFGRKNFMIIAFTLAGLLLIALFVLNGTLFIQLATGARFFLLMTFTLAYQYTVEVYNTTIRGTGIGMASAVSRIGGIIMPYIGITLMSGSNYFLPYLAFGVASLLAGFLCYFLPYDTTDRELDLIEKDSSEDEILSKNTGKLSNRSEDSPYVKQQLKDSLVQIEQNSQ